MGTNWLYKCPPKRESEGDLTHTESEDYRKAEAEVTAMWPQLGECWQQLPDARQDREGFSPGLQGGKGSPAERLIPVYYCRLWTPVF